MIICRFFIFVFTLIFFTGCFSFSSSQTSTSMSSSRQKRTDILFNDIMSIKVDCSVCSGKSKGFLVDINGIRYNSDMALKCCLRRNLLDTNISLKKVYIHRLLDERNDIVAFDIINKYGKHLEYAPSFSLEYMFYKFLSQELQSRGILVVEQPSDYSYRVDFSINKIIGTYDYRSGILNSELIGNLKLSGAHVDRERKIRTTQNANKLMDYKQNSMDFFISILLKQAANKVAEQIAYLKR